MKNNFRTRDHDFVTFAPHLFDEDRDLHFAAGVDLESARDFRVFHLERDVGSGLADEPLADVPRCHKFSFAAREGRIVYQDPHPDRGRIDIDKLKRRMLFAIGQRLADVNFFEPG